MIEIIPAIDIMNGECVRLRQGDFAQKTTYENDPVAMAQQFEKEGARRVHVVDLDAARTKSSNNFEVIRAICQNTRLKVDVGGGIQDFSQIDDLLKMGVAAVNIGSMAIDNPHKFRQGLSIYGARRIWLSADIKNEKVAVNGWQQQSEYTIDDLLKYFLAHGLKTAVITAVDRDGMLCGPDQERYEMLQLKFPELEIIASGGVSTVSDLQELSEKGVTKAIVGKAIYERQSLQNFNSELEKNTK